MTQFGSQTTEYGAARKGRSTFIHDKALIDADQRRSADLGSGLDMALNCVLTGPFNEG